MINQLITASKEQIVCDFLGVMPDKGIAYVQVKMDADAAKRIFSDPAHTSKLTFGDRTVSGYTTLTYVRDEGDGWVKVCLAKE